MSTDDARPRTREILVATVNALRGDDTLAGLVYDSPPSVAADRQRIRPTWSGHDSTPPAEITVEPVAGSTARRGGEQSNQTQLQVTVLVTESWLDGHSILDMHGIRDRCAAVLESPVAPSVYPGGSDGRESPIEAPDGSGRLLLPLTVEVATHWTTH